MAFDVLNKGNLLTLHHLLPTVPSTQLSMGSPIMLGNNPAQPQARMFEMHEVGHAKPPWMTPQRGTGTAISKIKVYFLHHAAGGILQLVLPVKTCYLIAFAAAAAAAGSVSK